ncbi:hypothetical protein OS493_030498 [Desmophyllum pertusum]|uniref:Uncharacterized protein n=1 Tax=Desmophyllum pertusum TaxID=174260 RepID=A0A9W9YJV1_9CNID|nr:hypothetical protein OS493_030498 [Desmophyllum pertusum]
MLQEKIIPIVGEDCGRKFNSYLQQAFTLLKKKIVRESLSSHPQSSFFPEEVIVGGSFTPIHNTPLSQRRRLCKEANFKEQSSTLFSWRA